LKKFIAILAACMLLTGITASSALAAPTFIYHNDDDGANDEPGQKDLTAQSADEDAGIFYTSWKWDELSFSGKNTGDGCSLFDTDVPGNGFVDYALCATIGGGSGPAAATLLTVSMYVCEADNRVDRCSGPTLVFAAAGADASTYCQVADGAGAFDTTDSVIVCNITAIGAAATPPITVVGSGTLINTCSYPSREPNSDPSDCVVTIPAADTTTVTTPTGSATFTATLNDSAQVTPAAAGTVVFNLYLDDGDPLTLPCSEAATFTASVATSAAGVATTTTNVTVAGTYNWTADFTPTDPEAFNPSASACGSETVTVVAPTVS